MRTAVALVLPFLWVMGTAAFGIVTALFLTFASDSGLPSPQQQQRAFVVALLAIGLAGLAGIPFGIAIGVEGLRGLMVDVGVGVLVVAAIGLLASLVAYFVPFVRHGR